MNCIINIPQVAYDLITGRIDTANLDLYSTLIQSVKNGIPLEQINNEVNKLKKVSDGNKVYISINDMFDIIDKYKEGI